MSASGIHYALERLMQEICLAMVFLDALRGTNTKEGESNVEFVHQERIRGLKEWAAMAYSMRPHQGPGSDSRHRIEEGATTSIIQRRGDDLRLYQELRDRQRQSTHGLIYAQMRIKRKSYNGKDNGLEVGTSEEIEGSRVVPEWR